MGDKTTAIDIDDRNIIDSSKKIALYYVFIKLKQIPNKTFPYELPPLLI